MIQVIREAIKAIESKQLAVLGVADHSRQRIYREFSEGSLTAYSVFAVAAKLDKSVLDRRSGEPKDSILKQCLQVGLFEYVVTCPKSLVGTADQKYNESCKIRLAGHRKGAVKPCSVPPVEFAVYIPA